MGDQFKSLVQNLVNPLTIPELENFLDDVVKKNSLAHWQLLKREVVGSSQERVDVCLGQDGKSFKEDELQLLQVALSKKASDPVETGTDGMIIDYWINGETDNSILKAKLGECKEGSFFCVTMKTPFINGTEYILIFKNNNSQITDGLTGKFVSAFLVTWRSISFFPEFRNTKKIKLGKREQQVLAWTSQGKTSFEISKILNLSEHTINNYVTNAANKLGTNNRVHTVCRAIMLGLI